MTKSQKAVLIAVLATALISYLHAIAFALGASSHGWISPFFAKDDLFADFFKFIGSFPSAANMRLESWFPHGWARIITQYLADNPYRDDVSQVQSRLTHFVGPPLGITLATLYGHLCSRYGPASIFLTSLLSISGWLYACARLSDNSRTRTSILFAVLCISIYPSIYAITRGHIWSYMTALSLCTSFLLVLRQPTRPALPSALMGFAINIRPNNILLLPVLFLAFPRANRNWRLLLNVAGYSLLVLLISLISTKLLYPAWTPALFTKAYGYYSRHYELGPGSKSFLHLLNHLAVHLLAFTGHRHPESFGWIIRRFLILTGLLICGSAYLLLARRCIGLPRALMLSIAGMIIATPSYADYHLLVLLAPIFCNNLAELHSLNGHPTPDSAAPRAALLTKADYALFIILILPKAFPIQLFGASFPAQTIVNPLAILIYVFYVVRPVLSPRLQRS